MTDAISRSRGRWRIACAIAALAAAAALSGALAQDAAATHSTGHVCVGTDFAGGQVCAPDPLNPATVDDTEVCNTAEVGIVGGCTVRNVQDLCLSLLPAGDCVYRDARRTAPEPEAPGVPSATTQSVLARIDSADCLVTDTALGQRQLGEPVGICTRAGGSQHNFFDCGSLPDHSWCISHERHSYYYGTSRWEGDHDNYRIFTCIKFIKDSNGDMIARACAYNFVELTVGDSPLKKPLVYNGDDYRRSIYGYARF